MVYKKHVYYILIVLVGLSITGCFIGFKPIEKEGKSAEKITKIKVSLDKDAGRINYLSFEGKEIDLLRAGGFHLYDATNNLEIKFSNGSLKKERNWTIFDASEDNIQLHAEFIPMDRFIFVKGRIKNLNSKEIGVLLDYTITLDSNNLIFSNMLNDIVEITDTTTKEGNVIPIGVIVDKNKQAIAMAIPPGEPRIFGMIGNQNGLTIRFYLGLSPATTNFPNSAPFAFIIYPVQPRWGFRNALSKYYSFYPEYYEPRVKRTGFCMFNVYGKLRPDIEHYAFNRINLESTTTDEDFSRDERYGLLSQPAINVGTKEIKGLSTLPHNEEQAMEVYKDFCSGDSATELCELIENSVCKRASGVYASNIRYTGWGGNSISFKINPNPKLFSKQKKPNVGSSTLKIVHNWYIRYPRLDGILIDALGANWPALLNYRRAHFTYAKYPLTVDPEGRVALHNKISHYEFLEELREESISRGKFLFGNGIYYYLTRGNYPEHYRAKNKRVKVGRFFLAALLDIASSEAGIKATHERFEFVRVAMGKKPYVLTNSLWKDIQEVEHWLNRCLLYGITGTNVRLYGIMEPGGKIEHYYPDFYKRDKSLFDWFIPKLRLLYHAGWEPVTYAETSNKKVLLERYGSGDKVYFTVMSTSKKEQECILSLDLESLGFKGDEFLVDEIAQSVSLSLRKPNQISLELKPFKTCIIALRKQ